MTVHDFDPKPAASERDFWRDSPLERMTRGAEDATDAFAAAVDAHSTAEAAYLRAFHSVRSQVARTAKSEAAAGRQAEDAAVEEKITERHAANAVESSKALMRTRLAVLSAAQSHLRSIERQT